MQELLANRSRNMPENEKHAEWSQIDAAVHASRKLGKACLPFWGPYRFEYALHCNEAVSLFL